MRGRDINRYTSKDPYEYIYFVEGTKVLTRSRKRENFEDLIHNQVMVDFKEKIGS